MGANCTCNQNGDTNVVDNMVQPKDKAVLAFEAGKKFKTRNQ